MNILLTTGYKNITDCKVGDLVVYFDQYTGERLSNTILSIRKETPKPIYDYSTIVNKRKIRTLVGYEAIKSYVINGTYNFFEDQSIWIQTGETYNVTNVKLLQVGDVIFNDNDEDIIVTSITESTLSEYYVLEISGDHSYICDGLSLHNASRYWVGGGASANWNATGNTNWSATYNGANNASVPTSSDSVYFTGYTSSACTISATANCYNLDCTQNSGYSGTITHNTGIALNVYGLVYKLNSGMTYTNGSTSSRTNFVSTGNTLTVEITMAGKSIALVYMGDNDGSNGSTFKWMDNFSSTGVIVLWGGTIDTNDFNTTSGAFYTDDNRFNNLYLRSGTWTLTGDNTTFGYAWATLSTSDSYGYVSVVGGTSTLKFNNSSSNDKYFIITADYNSTYYNLHVEVTGSGYLGIGEVYAFNLSLNEFKISPACNIKIFNTGTISASTFTMTGTSGNLITLKAFGATSYFNFIKIGAGTTNCDYLDLTNSRASTTNGAVWNAGVNSIDSGYNSGWIFIIDRYFINGGVNSLTSNINNWSNTSGGTGGYAVLASAAIYFDSNSPNTTIDSALTVKRAYLTDYTNTITNDTSLKILSDGSDGTAELVLDTGTTFAGTGDYIMGSSTGTNNAIKVTSNGKALPKLTMTNSTGSGQSLNLQDDLTVTGAIVLSNSAKLNMNTVSGTGKLYANGDITVGTSTTISGSEIVLNASGADFTGSASLTFNSKISFTAGSGGGGTILTAYVV